MLDSANSVPFVQLFALARAHRYVPRHARPGIRALVNALIARVTKTIFLPPLHQAVAFYNVGHVARGPDDGVHQSSVCIHANVGLHAKVGFSQFPRRFA
jgi:hypothetical protein